MTGQTPPSVAPQLSTEASERLMAQLSRVERHVIARAVLLAAQNNDDVVSPSQVEAAWNDVLGKPSRRTPWGLTIVASAVLGGTAKEFVVGVGKSVGEYLQHVFR